MKPSDRDRYKEMKRDMQTGATEEFLSEHPTATPAPPIAGTDQDLSGLKVAVLVADGFEQVEFDGPTQALRRAGATVSVLAPDAQHLHHIKGVHHHDPGPGTKADKVITEVKPEAFDMLLVPGGLYSPDAMRQSQAHLAFVKAFMDADKPVAMICHGLWLLADADKAQGRTLTSWPAIKKDMTRAGAKWVDQEVVTDGNLVTSRKPDDIPAFSHALIKLAAERMRGR